MFFGHMLLFFDRMLWYFPPYCIKLLFYAHPYILSEQIIIPRGDVIIPSGIIQQLGIS
jgi:hypothetical protein